jgi:hypothetical protein
MGGEYLMAKTILWIFVIIGFIVLINAHKHGMSLAPYTKIAILSSLSVLAICESIERSKKA